MASSMTFLLIPGAWHPASTFEAIGKPLRDAGYNVRGIDLVSYGADPPLKDFGPDVEVVRKAIEEEADKGMDVVLFMHSYGGVVGTEACRGLDKKSREASGRKGGAVRLIYCCAFILAEGVCLLDMIGGKPLPWLILSSSYNGISVGVDKPEEIFYNDLTPEQAQQYIKQLADFSYGCFTSKLTDAAYKDIPTTYLLCTKDNAIPIHAQQAMVEAVEKLGVKVDSVTFEASHSPFLSLPGDVVTACTKAVG